jgi:response regulator NasT
MFLSAFSDDATVAQVRALGAVAYLVKPLDIRQIVPAVEAAFAQRGAARQSAAPTAAPDALVAMAAGVLMHRYSLRRDAAFERLRRGAAAEGVSLPEHASRLLDAIERLASGADPAA